MCIVQEKVLAMTPPIHSKGHHLLLKGRCKSQITPISSQLTSRPGHLRHCPHCFDLELKLLSEKLAQRANPANHNETNHSCRSPTCSIAFGFFRAFVTSILFTEFHERTKWLAVFNGEYLLLEWYFRCFQSKLCFLRFVGILDLSRLGSLDSFRIFSWRLWWVFIFLGHIRTRSGLSLASRYVEKFTLYHNTGFKRLL